MSEIDAYFAGLFDGEGYVSVEMNGKHEQIYIKIDMTCIKTIRAFADYAGCGSLSPKKPHKPHNKPQYRIRIQGPNAVRILNNLLPYLITKRDDVRACIDRYEARPTPKRGRPLKSG